MGSSQATEKRVLGPASQGRHAGNVASQLFRCPVSRVKSDYSAFVEKYNHQMAMMVVVVVAAVCFKGISCHCVKLEIFNAFEAFPVYKCQRVEREERPQTRALSSIQCAGTFTSPSAPAAPPQPRLPL